MSYVATYEKPGIEVVSALQKMREGILFAFIAWIFLGAGIMAAFFGALTAFAGGAGGAWVRVLAGLGVGIVLLIVGAIIALIGFYAKFIPGTSDLARGNPEFSTASSLIKIGYVWGLILVIIGAILTLVLVGIFIVLIGFVLLIIGYIGMIILCFKLNDAYQNTLYLVAGILFIIGIFFPIVSVVAWILIYIALGDTIRKLRTPPTQAQSLIQV